jgi:hypothetical protein
MDDSWGVDLVDYVVLILAFAVVYVCVGWVVRWWLPGLPPGKPAYVACNAIKAYVLAAIAAHPLYALMMHDVMTVAIKDDGPWTTYDGVIRWLIVVYCATDAAQFRIVPMQPSTFWHHVVTTGFGVWVVIGAPPGALTGLTRALVVYGAHSVGAYAVNAYLAARLAFNPSAPLMTVFRYITAIWYANTIRLHFVSQYALLTAITDPDWTTGLYGAVLAILLADDFKLMASLVRPPRPAAHAHGQ